jgi:hypothetical protein
VYWTLEPGYRVLELERGPAAQAQIELMGSVQGDIDYHFGCELGTPVLTNGDHDSGVQPSAWTDR